jgi:tetratricopeptide (TPR) repeat protein
MTRRLLVFCAAFTLVTACKKDDATQPPDEGATAAGETGDSAGEGGEKAEPADPGVPQEPDPPEIAEARTKVIAAEFEPAATTLEPMWKDLRDREQYRASGLAAAWYSLAVVNDIAENAHESAEYAVTMAEKTGDPEVVAAANIAIGSYNLGIERYDEAIAALEKAFEADRKGKDAALAMIVYSEVRISNAFGGTDQITKPEELDAAATALEKAQKIADEQGQDVLLGRALVNRAAVARYKGDDKRACALVMQGMEKYESGGAGEWLTSGGQALKDAAMCK